MYLNLEQSTTSPIKFEKGDMDRKYTLRSPEVVEESHKGHRKYNASSDIT